MSGWAQREAERKEDEANEMDELITEVRELHTRLSAIIAERDALRAELARLQAKLSAAEDAEDVKNGAINNLTAELAAAKEEIAKMRSTIISAMVDVQHNLPGNGHAKLSLLLDGIMKQPRNNEERLLADRKALAADNARLREALQPFADRIKAYPPWMWTAMVEREKQGIITGGFRVGGEAVTHMPAVLLVQAEEALAATPAQSLAAHDAALLREVANKFETTEIDTETREPSESYDCGYKDGQYSAVNWLMANADRIKKEAQRG